MAAFSKRNHQAIAAWLTGAAMLTPPTGLVLALSNGDPKDDLSGLVEPTGSGYLRQPLSLVVVGPASNGGTLLSNVNPLVFGPVVDNNWPTLTHGAVLDSNGNLHLFGALGVSRAAPIGDTVSFGAGALQFVIK